MTDNEGISDSGSVTAETSAGPVTIPSNIPPEVKETALKAIAKDDNADDYASERKAQNAEERGERLTAEQRAQRGERYRKAIERNLADLQGSPPDSAQIPNPASSENSEGEQRPRIDEDRIRKEERFNVRAESYVARNEFAADDMKVTFEIFPPSQMVRDLILESDMGVEVAHELTKFPDAIQELNEMPRDQAARVLGVVEGRLRAARMYEDNYQPAPQRRQTKAPAPLSQVRGGASPASSLQDLAKSDDATAYANARKAQQKALGR